MDNNEVIMNDEEIFPPNVLRLWLESNSPSVFYDNLKSTVLGQDEALKKSCHSDLWFYYRHGQ